MELPHQETGISFSLCTYLSNGMSRLFRGHSYVAVLWIQGVGESDRIVHVRFINSVNREVEEIAAIMFRIPEELLPQPLQEESFSHDKHANQLLHRNVPS